MKFSLKSVAAVLLSIATAFPAVAQQTQQMPGMQMPTPKPMPGMAMKPGAAAADSSMMSSMEKMSKDMAAVPMSGDADRDFAGMMMPHHQGAIDMAKYELAHGKDPVMLKLARGVVAAQEKEIGEMKAWLAKHPAAK